MAIEQPFVHDLTVALAAPVQVWSAPGGDIDGSGVQGAYYGDHRMVRGLQLDLQGPDGPIELVHGATSVGADGTVTFHTIARIHDGTADPLGAVTRTRAARPGGMVERITIGTSLPRPLPVTLTLRLQPDATPMALIKAGVAAESDLLAGPDGWGWDHGSRVTVSAPEAEVSTGDSVHLCWQCTVPAYGAVTVSWQLAARDDRLPFVAAQSEPLQVPTLVDASASLQRLVQRSIADLNALRLAERDHPSHTFFAAGAPWFLTLFGRDSLIAARLLLPVDSGPALGTLRTLAARQGRGVDIDRAEQVGKILHEVRAEALDLQQGIVLPPEYYGTIDATALWIVLLGELADTGIDPRAEGLFEPLEAALGWLRDSSDADGDGFAEYFDTSGHGLSNQGWKDSGDSVRFADGTIAEGPIALAEVQGYAYAAALAGADLLERFGTDPDAATGRRDWAQQPADRFRQRFWIADERGAYPAMALDRHKRPVTGVASNMGHLLGTGLLNPAEEQTVVRRLMGQDMFSGYGVRTMSTTNAAYWPTRYHVGSVWTHDTAMIIEGMLRAGYPDEAASLARGLLRAAEGFDHRLPELFGGQSADKVFPPVPYPASCRPQAWAAAAGISVARALGAL